MSVEEDSNDGPYNLDFDEIKEELLRNLYSEHGAAEE